MKAAQENTPFRMNKQTTPITPKSTGKKKETFLGFVGEKTSCGRLDSCCKVGTTTASLCATLLENLAIIRPRRAHSEAGDVNQIGVIGKILRQTVMSPKESIQEKQYNTMQREGIKKGNAPSSNPSIPPHLVLLS